MRWLKIRHNEGYDLINVQHVYRLEIRSDKPSETEYDESLKEKAADEPVSYEIVLFDANSIMPTVLAWNTSKERNSVLRKIEEALNVINL